MAAPTDDKSLALYCDFENIALGVRDAKYQKFDIHHILERLLVKGSIVVKKAYCDWDRYKNFKGSMHEAAFELIEIPHVRMSGKNSADIRMVVDALDLCYTKSHVDTFVIISGDSDFSPLVSKLRENAKTVIGVGVKNSTSDLLISSCDEFIYYDDLVRELERKAPKKKRASKKRAARVQTTGTATEPADEPDADASAEPGASASGEKATGETAKGEKVGKTPRPQVDGADAAAADRASGAAGESEEASGGKPAARRTRGGARRAAGSRGKASSAATEASASTDGTGTAEQDELLPDATLDDATDDNSDEKTSEELAQEGLDMLLETASALSTERGGADKLWGSMVKQTLKRRRPGFNESYYGFDSFGKMLEEAAARGYLALEHDDRSGGYIITTIRS